MSCNITIENALGPQVKGCLQDFDFTLLFEETVLSIAPLIAALLLVSGRIYRLWKQSRKVYGGGILKVAKVATFAIFAALQLSLFVLILLPRTPKTRASIACMAISFIGMLPLWLLSYLEYTRAVRPSVILETYLLFSLLCDIVRDRTLWALSDNKTVAAIFTTSVVMKVVLVVLESVEKRGRLQPPYANYPPEATAGVYSRSLFWWLTPLLKLGFNTELLINQLYPNDKTLIPDADEQEIQKRWNQCNQGVPHSFLWIYTTHYKWHLSSAIIPRLGLTGFKFAQPFLVNAAVGYLSTSDKSNIVYKGYGLIAAYSFVYVGIAICGANFQHKTYRVITMARGTIVSLIYQRTLELSTVSLDESKAVTLMSADVERIGTGLRSMHELWASSIEIALALWLIQRQLGIAAVSAGLFTLLCTSAAIVVASGAGPRQNLWLESIQKRVNVTASTLGSMKGMKLSGLTNNLGASIERLREEEITSSLKFRRLLVAIVNLSFMSTALTPVVAFGVFSVLAKIRNTQPLNTDIAFTSLALFELLAEPVSVLIDTLAGVMSAVGSFERVAQYLSARARDDGRLSTMQRKRDSNPGDIGWKIDRVDLSPEFGIEIPLMSMPRITTPLQNCIEVRGLRAGWGGLPILADLNFNIKQSQLTMIIGPVGCGKSTLLKALLGETPSTQGLIKKSFQEVAYCDQTPWITSGTVQQNILGGSEMDLAWYNTIIHACELDTDIQLFDDGDKSMVGSKGITLSGGQQTRLALARAVYPRKSVIFLDDVFSGLDATTEEKIFTKLFDNAGLLRKSGTTVVLATNSVHRLPSADYIISLGNGGELEEQGTFEVLNSSGGYTESLSLSKRKSPLAEIPDMNQTKTAGKENIVEKSLDARDRRIGDTTIYGYYIGTFGWYRWMILVAFAAAYGFFTVFPQVWVEWWTASSMVNPNGRLGYYLGIYTLLGILSILALLGACWHLVINLVPRTGRKMHHVLLQTVLNAPMSFFQKTNTGVTINRFSQDLELIDMELPLSVINVILILALLVAQIVVISATGRYVAAAVPFCIGIVYLVQKYYLRTSRQLRLLDIEAKSPLFSHFLETIAGVTTIRAFGWEKYYLNESKKVLEISQRPYYLLFCVQRWLGLVLDLTVAAIAIILITVSVLTRGKISAGLIGLALVNIVGFGTTLKQLLTNWTLLETSLGGISRVRSFEKETPSENQLISNDEEGPPADWPKAGSIEFNNISSSYRSSKLRVLKNVSLKIKSGQRVGICGRSGSGKSSLIATLFRILDLDSGNIVVDGFDIATTSRQTVRSRLNAIPQEPYLITGTVRLNVDPLRNASDEDIACVLKKVHLMSIVMQKGGLDAELTPDFFSHGQQQLMCLARAILRKRSVLVLDEATSSVDIRTDELMQKIIREEFSENTIISVAHRLDSIIDFDLVVVLAAGEIIELDTPGNLLASPSKFKEMYMMQKGE